MLEVKNAQGDVIKKWKENSKRVIDAQVPFLLQSILSDDNARAPSFGRGASGLNVPGVKTFTKTGTSNLGTKSKDLWMNSVSPKVTMSIWVGNHDTRPMSNALSSIVGPTVNKIMGPIHTEIFQKEGTWKPGDWFTQPAGIQNIKGEFFPSWYNQKQASSSSQLAFDKVSKKKATSCTPEGAKVNISVTTVMDPVTKKNNVLADGGYDASADDDVHVCGDVVPLVTATGQATNKIHVEVTQGKNPIQSVTISVVGGPTTSGAAPGPYDLTVAAPGTYTVNVTATDSVFYTNTNQSITVTVP